MAQHQLASASLSLNSSGEKASLDVVTADFKPNTNRSVVADQVVASSKKQDGCGVRVLRLDEYKAAAASLAEAFKDDHTTTYFLDTPDRAHWSAGKKWDLHVSMMEYITYAHLLKGLVVSAGENHDCVGLWMPPGNNMDDYLTLLRSGLWRLSYQLSPEGRSRFFDEFLPLLNTTKANVLGPRDQDSWYLVYIGTRPSGRGKGYARKVIDYVTRIADEEGKACYLESSADVNQVIYGRMGFELRKCVYLQRDVEQIRLDIMVREPKGREGDVIGEKDRDSGVDVK